MSHGNSPVTLQDARLIVTAEPIKISTATRVVLWLFIFIGVAAFIYGIRGDEGEVKHAWVSLQVNFIYWFSLAAASTCFAAVFHICNAQWTRPIRRLFESSSRFFLYSAAPLVVLFFGQGHLFQWSHEAIAGKEFWLSSPFLYVRDLIGIALLVVLARRLIFFSLQRDIAAIRCGLTGLSDAEIGRWKNSRYDRYVASFKGDAKAQIQAVTDKMGRLSPIVVMVYAVVMTLIAFDQVMSVDAHWYSTLFGAFLFMSAVYLAVAWCSMGVGMAREAHPLFRAKVERRTLHDLGKLLLGFGIFWAYLFWSHYLTIWYANIPEETHWMIIRLRSTVWHGFAWLILGSCFVVPFLIGLSKDAKQVPTLLFTTGTIVACGLWLQTYLLFAPTLYPNYIPLNFVDVLVAMGFLGAYILSAASFLEEMPLMPFGDLYQSK